MSKYCYACKETLPLNRFSNNRTSPDGLQADCKDCASIRRKNHYRKNKLYEIKLATRWIKNNPKKVSAIQKKVREKRTRLKPWLNTLKYIKARCNNHNKDNYNSYGGRGIKCLINAKELKKLWYRDNAYLMKKPSIDRIDSNDNYTFNNCQYLEFKDNCKKQRRNKSYA